VTLEGWGRCSVTLPDDDRLIFADDFGPEIEELHVSEGSGRDQIGQRRSVCGLTEFEDLDMLVACWL
jgi:hypothetical protein